MSAWQLVAHPEEDVCDRVVSSVRKALRQQGPLAQVDSVTHVAAVWESIERNGRSDLDLIVIAATMPADEQASVGSSNRDATKQFIKRLKASDPALPVIVVASTPDEALASFLDAFDQTGLVTIDHDFGANLVRRIVELRTGVARHADCWIELDIHLGGQQSGNWKMNRVGRDAFEERGPFLVERHRIERIIKDSKRLDNDVAKNDGEWFDRLKQLSSDLRELLFRSGPDNMDFWDKFVVHRERVGGVARSRIRVTVDEATHSMLLEALRDSQAADGEFWALKAPVFRRYAQKMAFPPLFKERDGASRGQAVNCLVIQADPKPGSVVDESGTSEGFGALRHLREEADQVEAILRQHAGGTVERLSLDAMPAADLLQNVLAKLAERQWHVVHFCGHVSGDATRAGLVLSADSEVVLPVKMLVTALERTQLLFLSSCRSAATRIVMHAVEQHVSAVVGFQWVIDDAAASAFAIEFYRQLFDTAGAQVRSLEYAMLEARRLAWQRQPAQPSWVAPVLVMQMG